jgi:hypothetical protein
MSLKLNFEFALVLLIYHFYLFSQLNLLVHQNNQHNFYSIIIILIVY